MENDEPLWVSKIRSICVSVENEEGWKRERETNDLFIYSSEFLWYSFLVMLWHGIYLFYSFSSLAKKRIILFPFLKYVIEDTKYAFWLLVNGYMNFPSLEQSIQVSVYGFGNVFLQILKYAYSLTYYKVTRIT